MRINFLESKSNLQIFFAILISPLTDLVLSNMFGLTVSSYFLASKNFCADLCGIIFGYSESIAGMVGAVFETVLEYQQFFH